MTGLLRFVFRNRIGIHRELDDIAFDSPDKLKIDEVMMILVARGAVLLGQFDAAAFDAVDGADIGAVLADDFHMFPNVRHRFLLWST